MSYDVESCRTCRYFDAKERECRANPPTVFLLPNPVSGGPAPIGLWPPSRPEFWCGAYRAKEAN